MMTTKRTALLLGLAGLTLMVGVGAAFAEGGSKIIVINRDGSSTEFVLPEGEKLRPPSEMIEQSLQPPPQLGEPGEPSAVEWIEQGIEPEQRTPPPMKEASAARGPVEAPAPPPKASSSSSSSSYSSAPARATDVALPGHKPDFSYEPYKWELPPGSPITKKAAQMIALEVAPPARTIEVYERVYQDRPVYQVSFKTEAGYHDVLVDAETGEILKR